MNTTKYLWPALALAAVLMAMNAYNLSAITTQPEKAIIDYGEAAVSDEIIPKGEPSYGQEIQFSYDDIDPYDQQKANAAIARLAQYDRQISLNPADNERYVKILYKDKGGISCEYCCGARSVIFQNGQPACGCAHSYAMRGLAKYLLTETDMTDEEILTEVAKLKVLFFPAQSQQKAAAMQAQGIEVGYLSLATNENRGLEQGISGGMVGGC